MTHFGWMENMTDKNGFSLVELLVAMAMASVIMAAMFMAHKAQVQGKISQEVTLELQQGGRAGIELMTRDLRMAGCDPSWESGAGFVTAAADEVEFTMDIAGGGALVPPNESDGDIDDPGEHITYKINTSGNLGRDTHGGNGAQPLVRNADALNFVYLDEDGNDLGYPADLAEITSVEVSFVVRSGTGGAQRGMLSGNTDTRKFYNLRGTQIFQAPGDAARRLQLSTTIKCRNMGRGTP